MNDHEHTIQEFIDQLPFDIRDIEYVSNDKGIICSFTTTHPQFLVGNDGEILRSLNHILRRILEKKHSTPVMCSLDINNFQKKREEDLQTIAHMAAERVRFLKNDTPLQSMSSYERRIIHDFLMGRENIKTESEGDEPYRKVIIRYVE